MPAGAGFFPELDNRDAMLMAARAFTSTMQGRDGFLDAVNLADTVSQRRRQARAEQHTAGFLQAMSAGADPAQALKRFPGADQGMAVGFLRDLQHRKDAEFESDRRRAEIVADREAQALQEQERHERDRTEKAADAMKAEGKAQQAVADALKAKTVLQQYGKDQEGVVPGFLARPDLRGPEPAADAGEELPGFLRPQNQAPPTDVPWSRAGVPAGQVDPEEARRMVGPSVSDASYPVAFRQAQEWVRDEEKDAVAAKNAEALMAQRLATAETSQLRAALAQAKADRDAAAMEALTEELRRRGLIPDDSPILPVAAGTRLLGDEASGARLEDQQKFQGNQNALGRGLTREEGEKNRNAGAARGDQAAAAAADRQAAAIREKKRAEAQAQMDKLRKYWGSREIPPESVESVKAEKARLMALGAR